ncbi:MAG: hypothetical protein H6Q10_227 [Acidobacteria bacterium]|nr:hypothetical protein [Acidobacteriota bacterium]
MRLVVTSIAASILALSSTAPVAGTADLSASPALQAKPAGDTALVPDETAVAGWKKNGAPRVFTRADLYGYIDGGAELFFEFGFDQLTLQKYRKGAGEVAVEIYRMTDPGAAAGTYFMKMGRETRDPGFRERHTVSRHQLIFQRHRYYVTVNNLTGTDGLTADLLRFGSAIASRLPAGVPPAEMKLLPAAGRVAGSERLFRGPVALQSLFTLGDGDILQQKGRVTGAAADYQDPAGTSTLLVVQYPTPAAASQAMAFLQQHLDQYLKPVSATPARLVFKDYENKFGTAAVKGARLEIRLHLPRAS